MKDETHENLAKKVARRIRKIYFIKDVLLDLNGVSGANVDPHAPTGYWKTLPHTNVEEV